MSRCRAGWSATLLAGLTGAALLLGGCDTPATPDRGPTSGSSTAAPQTAAPSGPASSQTPEPSLPPEPTTTNTLPPPPEPTAPAPKSAGALTRKDLPRPDGWKTVARPGGAEEGYRGNGSGAQGRDPRYAAQDAITIGCASITRDDYPDPVAALQGTYGKRGDTSTPGIALLMQFGSGKDADAYYQQYVKQVRACGGADAEPSTEVVDSRLGLIDRRHYSDGTAWTEMAGVHGNRVSLVILTDPDQQIDRAAAEAVLRQFRG